MHEVPLIEEAEVMEIEFIAKYKFITLFIEKCVKLFPTAVELYIQSSIIQSTKLANEFKAIF